MYTDHPIVVGEPADGSPEGPPLPGAIYLDGVPYSQTDGVIGVWLENLVNGKLYCFLLLRKKTLCKCGCRGWCTLQSIFRYINWCLRALARGRFPTERHDLKEFTDREPLRADLAGKRMRRRVAILYIKGDWAEYAHTLGLPSWSECIRPCWICNAYGDDMYECLGNGPTGLRWNLNDEQDYYDACDRCEHVILLTDGSRCTILAAGLRYDKRKNGVHGRCLRSDAPTLGLRAEDRLEPTVALPDVGAFETAPTGITIVFWRSADETLTKHRNPIFDRELGLSPQRCLTIDTLHSINLGIMKVWAKRAIWYLILSRVYGDVGTSEEMLQLNLMVLRSRLKEFQAANPKHTRLHDLTPKMIGKVDDTAFKPKGAETWTLFRFFWQS